MGRASWKHFLIIALSLLPYIRLVGQITDCVGAQIICSDGRINFIPNGRGADDFANPKNNPGCLEAGEAQTAWYYFEFREDMPPNSVLEFTISPFLRPGRNNPDYDFIIYGPDVKCDSLGLPLRCSFAFDLCDFCPETGLGRDATDTSEAARGTDGFLKPMIVQPREGYYLMLDNFKGDATGFTLTWGGSAAPYLNCLANPLCRNKTVDAGDDMEFCQNPAPFKLNASVKNVTRQVKYEWLGTEQALSFLNSNNILQPTVTIPANFTGSIDYILSITDGDCVIADAISVNVFPNPPAQIRGDTEICQGESTTLSVSGTYQSYLWSNGATTPSITVNTGGNYTVTVSNGGTCTNTATITVNVRETPKPIIDSNNKFCSGETLTLRTNTPFATYFWSNGDRNATTTISRGGNYSVTVTDAGGCRGTGALSITEFSKPVPEIIGNATFCAGQTATLRTAQPYTAYLWSSNETTATITQNTAGRFSVTVTDANGCQGVDDISLTQNPLPTLSLTGKPFFCETQATQLTANTNAAQIRWSNGANTSTIEVSTAGNYVVTVTSSDGCQQTESITVRQQPRPQPFITDSITICPETAATLSTQGNFAQHQWSTGATTPTIKVTEPGDYTVQVTDSVGCTATATQKVGEFPTVPVPTISGATTFCPDVGTRLTANGNYQGFVWSNGQTGASIQVFTSGTFIVTVSDANGCTNQASIRVQAFAVTAPASDTVSFCSGSSTFLSPGRNYISYNWSNGRTQSNITIFSAGLYSVTVTDGNGCKSSATYTVLENALPQITIQGESRFCKNSSTELTVSPGFQRYRWSTNDTIQRIRVQTPGVYSITVTDANGCSASANTRVVELPLPTPQFARVNNLCVNETVTLSLTTPFRQYAWSDGSQQNALRVSQGGTYAVTVTDENGCSGSVSTVINAFPNPTVTIAAKSTLCQGTSAGLKATPGFTAYQWSNGGTQDSITIQNGGNYSVTVTDNNGCEAADTVNILTISAPIADAGKDQALNCNTRSVQVGAILAEQGSYRFTWLGPGINNSNVNQQRPFVTLPGNYTLVVLDTLNGCQSTAATVQVVDQSYTPKIILQVQDTLDCNTPVATVNANGSQQGDGVTYQWYNARREVLPNERQLNFTTNQAGLYYFEITDALTGCRAIDSIEVTADLDPAFVDAGTAQTLNCYQSKVTLIGSTSSEEDHILYKWMSPDGNRISNALITEVDQPGWYILMVTNVLNGCSNMDSVLVTLDRTPPAISAGPDLELDCNIPAVELQGSVPTNGATIQYTWKSDNDFVFGNPNQLTPTVNLAGRYTLEAQNLANGCIATDVVIVTNVTNPPTGVELNLKSPTCFGYADGLIEINSVSGGTGPYFFSLNGTSLETVTKFDSLVANTYKLLVEDVSGCQYETEISLKEGPLLKVDLGKDTVMRFGSRITLEAFVNVPTQTITDLKWSGKIIDNCYDGCWLQPVAGKELGTFPYTVTVTDEKGCVATDEILVTVKPSRNVFIPNAISPNGDGYNDQFVIHAGREVTSIKKLIILNRWGNLVFQATDFRPNDPSRGWNGRLPDGNAFNPGVFVYYAEIEFTDNTVEVYEGDITVVK
ncbi:MAG: gliding motility-associated C-terminal domain-containing protein [Saprospiraceae bacterium]